MAVDPEKLVRLLRDGNVMEPLDIQRIKVLQRKFDNDQKLSLKELGLLREYSMKLIEEVFNNPLLYNELRRAMIRAEQEQESKHIHDFRAKRERVLGIGTARKKKTWQNKIKKTTSK